MTAETKRATNRRDFLKISGVAAALAYSGGKLFPDFAGKKGLVKALSDSTSQAPSAEWKSSFCSGCHQPTCAIQVKMVNGVAVEVKGDKDSPTNKGRLCPRGLGLVFNQYNPYRIKTPLKRTNPNRSLDEDPGWVEISWEEALSTVAEKFKEIFDTDPRGLLYQDGFGREEEAVGFYKAFGTPNRFAKNGTFCPEHFAALHLSGTTLDRLDLERCNYVVLVGGTRGGGFVISDSSNHFVNAVKRGMKVVSVDPHYNNQARMGEWAPIRPGTETAFGLALLHTMIHEIGRYDVRLLKIRSNGTYLVPLQEEHIKGTRVFTADYVRDPETNKPLVWDEEKGAAVPFDDSKGETYALTGTYEVNGQKVQPCFQALSDYVLDFTPEWASKITTLPAEQIRDIARNLVEEARIGSTIEIDGFQFPYRPAGVDIRRACAGHRLGTEAYKALIAVNVLLGNSDVPGGLGGTSSSIGPRSFTEYLKPDEDGLEMAEGSKSNQVVGGDFKFPPDYTLAEFYPHWQGISHWGWKAIVNPEQYYIDYPIKGLMHYAGNPFQNGCNNRYVKEAFKKIPFIVSIAYHLDEPAQLADILLPEDSILEATTIYRMFRNEKESIDETRALYMTLVKHQTVDRLYDTRNANDIFMEIAERVGFLEKLNKDINKGILKGDVSGLSEEFAIDPATRTSWEEIVERKLKTFYGADTSYADFAEHAFKADPCPSVAESYNYYSAPDNAVRLPIYFHRLPRSWRKLKSSLDEVGATIPNQDMEGVARHYSAFPVWYEPPNYGEIKDYPLYAIQWKDHFTNQNTSDRVGNPVLQDVIDHLVPDAKSILIPPAVARDLGIQFGDEVWVEATDGGKTKGTAHISSTIHPECIGISGNYGKVALGLNPIARTGPHFNMLMSPEEKDCDPVEGSLELAPRVKVYKA